MKVLSSYHLQISIFSEDKNCISHLLTYYRKKQVNSRGFTQYCYCHSRAICEILMKPDPSETGFLGNIPKSKEPK